MAAHLSLVCLLSSCTDFIPIPPRARAAGSVLRSGFEEETVRSLFNQTRDTIRLKVASGQSFDVPIQYEVGTYSDRFAKVIADPTSAGNKVLQYWMKHARIPGQRPGYYKGRIQLHLSGVNKPEVYQRYRMYLHPDLNMYRSYPEENRWFTIMTLWVGAPQHPFKISLNIGKEKGVGKPLYFLATGDVRTGGKAGHGKWKTVWGQVNRAFEVPVGKWMHVEAGYKQGNNQSGRFYLAVRRESDASMTTIFDITDWTYHPQAPRPIPLTNWHPLKLYTAGGVIDHIRANGGVAQIYWDDLEIWDGWPK